MTLGAPGLGGIGADPWVMRAAGSQLTNLTRTGELYVISNGEMRFICNYSRGLYSAANVTLKIAARDLGRALPLLRHLGQEATTLLEDLREPWQVISESGVMAEQIELTLAVRAHFGHAVSLRPRLLSLVHERLAQAGIELV